MEKSKIALALTSLLMASSAVAEYSVKMPIHTELNFVNHTPTPPDTDPTEPGSTGPETPAEEPFDYTPYQGAATIQTASGGWVESSNLGNAMHRAVTFRSWGDVSIWLKGDQTELAEKATGIKYTVNGDAYDCIKYEAHYSDSTNETGFHCSITTSWTGNYSVGQQFNIEFY